MPDLHTSIDVNIRGFAHKRSRTHPYVVKRLGKSLWSVRDAPRRGSKPERTREYFAVAGRAGPLVDRVTADAGSARYMLCVAHAGMERDSSLEAAYKALGFRVARGEGLFVRGLPPVPRRRDDHEIERVLGVDAARRLARAAGARQLTEAEAADPDADLLVHVAQRAGEPIGWAGSVRIWSDHAAVIDVYVEPEFRRRGIGQALMRSLLQADARRGIRQSHLIASRAGGGLYATVGYRRIGTLTLFYPPKR